MQYSRAFFCLNRTLLCLLGQDDGIVEFFSEAINSDILAQ
jgi:hypothetical protein